MHNKPLSFRMGTIQKEIQLKKDFKPLLPAKEGASLLSIIIPAPKSCPYSHTQVFVAASLGLDLGNYLSKNKKTTKKTTFQKCQYVTNLSKIRSIPPLYLARLC